MTAINPTIWTPRRGPWWRLPKMPSVAPFWKWRDGKILWQGGNFATSCAPTCCRFDGSCGPQIATITGSPTGGNFTLAVGKSGELEQVTANIAYNASAATVQTRIENLSNFVPGDVTVTGSAGGPYTITFSPAVGCVGISPADTFTGGTSPIVVITGANPDEVTVVVSGVALCTGCYAIGSGASQHVEGDINGTYVLQRTRENAFCGYFDGVIRWRTYSTPDCTGPTSSDHSRFVMTFGGQNTVTLYAFTTNFPPATNNCTNQPTVSELAWFMAQSQCSFNGVTMPNAPTACFTLPVGSTFTANKAWSHGGSATVSWTCP